MIVGIDRAAEGGDQTAAITLHNGIIVSIKATDGFTASARRVARALQKLSLSFAGDAGRAGYYIENRRGRNRLVPLEKELTIHDNR